MTRTAAPRSLGDTASPKNRAGRFNREKAIELGIPAGPLFSRLQGGEPVVINGRMILPSEVMGVNRPGRKIVYSGDTRPCGAVETASYGADLLIHDCTLADELKEWAIETKHSTAKEAAELAKRAKVKELILTHISSRYSESPGMLLQEAKRIFQRVKLAEDLMELEIPLSDK